jgi:hypothetical protein
VSIVDTPDWANKSAPTGSSQYIIDTEFDGPNATVTMVGGVSEAAHPQVTALAVDQSGRLTPYAPNASSGIITVGTSLTEVIPDAGQLLYSLDVLSSVTSDATGHIEANGVVIAAWEFSEPGSRTIDLMAYEVIFEVQAIASSAGFKVVLRYALLD